ncbi:MULTISPECIES: hypothetical protein [unclassified Oceanispirochaeta]|uniref:hypothetical protein n=1 Tax=unclassified Oceanispirochaeta TaxID=2635722 RepID=UPI000E09D291|nr:MULTISPECIES: hypothetical protein [unclassified Oceanispirochaeta]MBF9015394.1 hypothetical protein [Oceanispirochaeta sp. M2]NPD71853.1 hypothetical protein [Oceanispirochaeta sp. M1]RDG32662.1 hypothetical protein DV872_07050 [Oceanispirochaeta sp. M1]
MGNNDIFSGDIDPEIASLLGIDDSTDVETPDYENLFNDGAAEEITESSILEEDISREGFLLPEKESQESNPLYSNPNYYKSILNGEGELAHNIHENISQFLKATDPKEKLKFRTRLIGQYWELYGIISSRIMKLQVEPKRGVLRYGLLLPNIVSAEQRKMLGSIIEKNETGEPIYYVDEWLEKVASGMVSPLATDDLKPTKRSGDQKVKMQLDKSKGSREAHLGTLGNLQKRRKLIEEQLQNRLNDLKKHTRNSVFSELESLYSVGQSKNIGDMINTLRELSSLHKDMSIHYDQLNKADQDFKKLRKKAKESGAIAEVAPSELQKEGGSIRQMAKLCVGRQGNHFPILMNQFFSSRLQSIATRENVIKLLMEIEKLDEGVFKRTFRQKTNRIVPHIILIPCYGDRGICWEPFERYNRATSRGRVAIPIFPKDLKIAVLTAVADLRWQVSKEKAQHYWMEEGLTGHYYQYFSDKKLRGDVRLKFIEDYILWITKEGEGVQKLDKEARGIFWRDIPFPQDLKDNLRKRGFVYNELYKKDMNRAASDGY